MKKNAQEVSAMLKKNERDMPGPAARKMNEELKASTQQMVKLHESAAHKERENILQIRRKSSIVRDDPSKSNQEIIVEMMEGGDDLNAELLKEKNEGLEVLERDMDALAEVVNDLNSMVHEQGEQLNVVEQNVVETKENVTVAVVDLGQARSYQASARKKMCIAAIIFLLVAIGAGLAIYFMIGRGTGGTSPAAPPVAPVVSVAPSAPVAPVAPSAPPTPVAPKPAV